MDLELSGRKALITGGSKGIGFAVAARLATEGCEIIIAARSPDSLAATAASLRKIANKEVRAHVTDTADATSRDRLVSAFPDIDILVNNAGAIPAGSLDTTNEQKWRASWDAKVFGYIGLTRAYLAEMKRRRAGVIINVIGIAGERLDANYVAGSSGNAALIAFTRAVGGTSLYDGVRVVGINPGPVSTERLIMLQKSVARDKFGDESRWTELLHHLPHGRAATPEEIADTIAFLASNRSSYTSGTVVNIDGGLSSRGSLF